MMKEVNPIAVVTNRIAGATEREVVAFAWDLWLSASLLLL